MLFWLLLLAAVIALAILYFTGPSGYVLNAAAVKPVSFRKRYFPMAARYRDKQGKPILREDRIIGRARGVSCESVGIRDGDVIVARLMDDVVWNSVAAKDVVIVKARIDNDPDARGLRIVAGRRDGKLVFEGEGQPGFDARSQDDVEAKVEMTGSF